MAKIWNNPITDSTDWGGDSSTNNLPVSGEQVQAWIKQRLSKVKTDTQLEDFITGILEEKGIAADGGFVTLKTEQSIEGAKDFVGGIKVSGAPIQYDAAKNAWVFAGNMVVTRGLAVNTSIDDFDKVSVFEDIPIDMETIKWKDGKLVAVGGGSGSGSGGIDEDQLKEYLDDNNYVNQIWINEQKYATQQWVEDKKYLTEASLGEKFVTIDTEQTVNAMKDFAAGIKVGGKALIYNADVDAWVFNGNLLVTGGAAFHSNLVEFDVHEVMDAIKYDKNSLFINDNGELAVIGGSGGSGEGGISEITKEMISNALGYTPYNPADLTKANIQSTLGISNWALESTKPSYAYTEISGTPTSLRNPYSISFSGYDTGSYDGSSALSIVIPEELPNPYSLSWSGYSSGSYDGSSSKSISIPYKLSQMTDDILAGYYLPIGGTAKAAEKLATSRKIWGQSFNGSGDITGAATVTTGEGYRVQYNGYDLRFIISDSTANRGIWDNNNDRWVFGLTSGTNVYLPSGNVGVGVEMGKTVSAKLHVNGNAFVSGQFAHSLSSDRRLKMNIRPFRVGKYLRSLGGAFEYEYIASEVERDNYYAGTHLGFIYQNVKGSKLKSMCIEREDGFGALNLFDSRYLALLGAAAVEHEDRIQTLERQIAVMQKELKQLKSA